MNIRACISLTLAAAAVAAAQTPATRPTTCPAHLEEILQWKATLESQPAAGVAQLRNSLANRLRAAGCHDELAELLGLAIFESATDAAAVEEFQRQQVTALLAAQRPQEALSAARSLFNVASMANTQRALLTLAECLNAARPQDADAVERLRREQIAGAAATTRPSERGILDSIPIDAEQYAAAIERWDPSRWLLRANEFRNFCAVGNLMLLAGRADEARVVFERLRTLAEGESQKLIANEGVARAIKAQTGIVGPANAFLRELRK